MTVLELKKLVAKKTDMQFYEMRLIFAGKDLVNDRQLQDYGMTPGSTLHMLKKVFEMQVFIRDLTSKIYSMPADLDMTVRELKEQAGVKSDVEICEMRLVFDGKDLQDHITLRAYKIGPDSTLHMLMRLTGC